MEIDCPWTTAGQYSNPPRLPASDATGLFTTDLRNSEAARSPAPLSWTKKGEQEATGWRETEIQIAQTKPDSREKGASGNPKCNHDPPSLPSALLLGPACHKKSTTLVCLAQGFSYKWPLDVSWKRDGQEVPHLSVGTEEVKEQGTCSFGIASRLSVAAEEWKEGYTYSCHVSQGNITANAEITNKRSQQTDSGIVHSLRIGQLIFLLLTIKSFAYGTVLGIYTVCRKTDF